MIATNHALTGALIGLSLPNPAVALALALASHVVCDCIPHFGTTDSNWISRPSFRLYLVADAAFCGLLVLILFVVQPSNWILPAAAAFLATSPDFLWIRKYRAALYARVYSPNLVERFLSVIQWFQRPIGAVVELVWFIGASFLLWQLL